MDPNRSSLAIFSTQQELKAECGIIYWLFVTENYNIINCLPSSCQNLNLNGYQSWKEPVQKWLKVQLKTFYFDGIRKFVDGWTKCTEKWCDYIEKYNMS
jgi:hypothetical protein